MDIELVKKLRDSTGLPFNEIKRALEEAGGDRARAMEVLKAHGVKVAEKKALRTTGQGLVEAYIHSNKKVGVLVELFCETDFVAQNPVFKELAHDLAMHLAAMSPAYLSLESVPEEVWHAEKSRFEEEVSGMNKPAHILAEIIDGKLKAHFGALSLLTQPFVKDQDKTVETIVNEAIGRFGENIKVGRFVRFEL